jgi:Zn-dependent oligopeptidase
MRRAIVSAIVLTAAPAFAHEERALMTILDAPGIAKSCEAGLEGARALIKAMEAKPGGEGFFAEWNRLQIAIEETSYPIANLGNLHPDKAVRDAAEPCQQKYSTLGTEIYQSEKLHARLKEVRATSAREEKLKKNLGEGFEDSGVALPAERRIRAREITTQLEKLRQDFERNVRDDATRVSFTAAELEGVDAAWLAKQKRDDAGSYVFTLDEPPYMMVMTNARSEAARQRYFIARANKGGMRNLGILDEAYTLRRERAGLHGLPSYADFVLRRRMAGSPGVVNKFLADVKGAVASVEQRELDELAAEKRKETGKPEAKLARWDVSYYQERVRKERFAVDQEKYRRYFPTDKSVDFAMLVAETLYGVKFREVKEVAAWHPEVRYYDMLDAKSGEHRAGLYIDLYPREGKRNGAWHAGVRRVSTLANRKPYSVLATNFSREGLNARERETLLHEFGHALHAMLSQAQYSSQAGTAVKRDFVEAPSQMFEEWVRREQPLALMKKVCAECPQLTREDIERLEAARRYGQALAYAAQWTYATLDMRLSTDPRPVLEVWKQIESATPLGHVEGTYRPASFGHIAGSGYASGYYGYMYSEVIGLDLLSPFKADMLDPAVGARYRDTILAQGGQVEEMEMVRRFLGREPSSEAFFAEITGKR